MKRPMLFTLAFSFGAFALSGFSGGSVAFAKERVVTDVDAVYQSNGQSHDTALKLKLEPGLYEIGEVDGLVDKEYLLVDTYSNDEEKILAIQFPKRAIEDDEEVIGYLYQGRIIKEGTALMLSPLGVDNSGNLRDESETRTDAAIVEVSRREGGYRYPYLLRGRNGALKNQLLGMKGASEVRPDLKPSPSNGVFASVSQDNVKLAVSGSEVSLYSGAMADQNFNLVPLNGMQGKFAALTKSTLDTMAGSELGDEQIKRLASFINGCFGRERMLIASPTGVWGEYRMHFFKKVKASFWDRIFGGGDLTPVASQNN